MYKSLFLALLLTASSSVAEESKAPIYRSKSGGSGMADIISRKEDKSQAETEKAKLAPEKLDSSENEKDKPSNKIYFSRSGGSGSAQFIKKSPN